ncbi:alpha/beta hydrolase [Lusitaniella coriacea LEGE 07157]|uniref:Alpha/beta hydrolase n=1 Tax=Lusitaniella coriacea LEGE 07157 TaxID=945747 RepID=A0A8J7DYZ6_9CYAN|nr:alpha/beta fold hydrolase [Lusitaniella coriacea]MBE9117878.1 alpha/beta hydrolase [Lusitaniella coriacea LEGE 07157]
MVASQNPVNRRSRTKLLGCAIAGLIAINAPVYLLAYHMTHVRLPGEKGIGVPKPQNSTTPEARGLSYTTHRIPINKTEWLEAWLIPTQQATSKGTVLLFPGNHGTKGSQLIPPAQSFSALGYDSLLIDFRGAGGSSGNTVTIGMKEAQDVSITFKYAQQMNSKSPIILYGVSMGSAAILRAIAKEKIKPDGVIVELPFSRLVNAIRSRLQHHRIPGFPTAEWVVFWGGIQHGVNGFAHNPVEYAKAVDCPVLVIHGEQDKWTTEAEIEALFKNLQGSKTLVTSPEAGHHQLIGVDRNLWDSSVKNFFDSL